MIPGFAGRRWVFAVLALLACELAVAAHALGDEEMENRPWRSRMPPHFYVDAAYFAGPGAEGALELYYEISNSQLQFLRKGAAYAAEFEIQAILYDLKGRQVTGDSWTRRLTRNSYEETVSPELSYTETLKLSAPSGKYRLVVRTENIDSGSQSSITISLNLRTLKTLPAISDPIIGLCRVTPGKTDSTTQASPRVGVEPYPRARFGEQYPSMCVYAEVYDSVRTGTVPEDTSAFRVMCKILDERGTTRLLDTLRVTRSGGTSHLLYSPPLDNLEMGRYTLQLRLGSGAAAMTTAGSFEIDESRFPLDINIDDTMTLLSYIARRSELDPIKEATGAERKALWMQFWAKRDPNPETPENEFLIEFFDRVRFANANFSYFGPGWKTDRGRIYIRRGPPDSIEARPVSASGPAYEVWYYYQLNLTFIFVDRTGLGQYELIGPSYE